METQLLIVITVTAAAGVAGGFILARLFDLMEDPREQRQRQRRKERKARNKQRHSRRMASYKTQL